MFRPLDGPMDSVQGSNGFALTAISLARLVDPIQSARKAANFGPMRVWPAKRRFFSPPLSVRAIPIRPEANEERSPCFTPSFATIPKMSSAPWTKEEDDAVMAKLAVVQQKLADQGRLGPVARLLPTTAATTIRKGREPLVIDGPFAETKEQLLGFYVVDSSTLDEAVETARELARASSSAGAFEIRPLSVFRPGSLRT